MKYRRLGKTDLEVSEVGFGSFPLSEIHIRPDGTPYPRQNPQNPTAVAVFRRAEELGVNLVDTAEDYGAGHNEELVGHALGNRRSRWVVATKFNPRLDLDVHSATPEDSRQRVNKALDGSLRRLLTDYVDIYQLHAMPFPGHEAVVMETLEKRREQGKIRYYGISSNIAEDINLLRQHGPLHVLQIGYNLLEREAGSLLDFSFENGLGTLIRVPLAKGQLTSKYFDFKPSLMDSEDVRYERFNRPESIDAFGKLHQLSFLIKPGKRTMAQAAIQFVLEHPAVSTVIPGVRTLQQLEENAAGGDATPLSEREKTRAFQIADTIQTPGWSMPLIR